MKVRSWREELYDFLISYGEVKNLQPAEIIIFLMSFCSSFMSETSDEEDARIFAKIFYDIALQMIDIKKIEDFS